MLIKVGLISFAISLAACSNQFSTRSPIPSSAKTIEEIYRESNAKQIQRVNEKRPLPDGASSLQGYTRTVYDELSVQFPRLPNPTIIMYVFPHLSLEKSPVPGYSTMFQLYERIEYALPGEFNVE